MHQTIPTRRTLILDREVRDYPMRHRNPTGVRVNVIVKLRCVYKEKNNHFGHKCLYAIIGLGRNTFFFCHVQRELKIVRTLGASLLSKA